MAKFIQARTKTILIQNPLLFILKNFIDGLATSGEIVNPIRHLLIVGHANLEGAFKIAMYESAKVAAKVFYEDLEDAIKNKAVKDKSLVMDLSVMYPRPPDPDGKTPYLLLLGCDIGDQAPYMQKFKEALGGQILLIAPKRIVIGATVRTPPGESAYMGYHFSLILPAKGKKTPAAKNRADLIDRLVKKSKDPEFALEDGSAPTRSSWKAWLPDNPNRAPNPTKPTEIANSVKLPVFPGTSNAPGHFFYIQERHFFSSPQTLALDKDTGKEADRKKAVKTDLQKLARYMDSHPFPEYVRFGYKTMDEFMDGWNWQFNYDKGTKVLSYDPIRDEYHLWQPIVRVATGTLVINYYPTGLVPKRFQSQMPIESIRVNDTFLFGVY